MATINPAVTLPGPNYSLRLATWTPLLNSDQGAAFSFVDWADRCFQVSGTFGTGGTIVLEGSNNGTDWSTLTDVAGQAMSYTAATVRQVSEAPQFVRPRVTAGDGTTSLTASLLARRISTIS